MTTSSIVSDWPQQFGHCKLQQRGKKHEFNHAKAVVFAGWKSDSGNIHDLSCGTRSVASMQHILSLINGTDDGM